MLTDFGSYESFPDPAVEQDLTVPLFHSVKAFHMYFIYYILKSKPGDRATGVKVGEKGH